MEKTRVLIITGDGKGKTTSAFGMALRSLGHGERVSVVQFIKHDGDYGEVVSLRQFPDAEVICSGLGFTPKREDSPQWARHEKAAQEGWKTAIQRMQESSINTIILDELFYPVRFGLIPLEEVVTAVLDFQQSEEGRILVMTGRNAPEELIQLADTVSRIECVKHAFQQGIKAQERFEY